jgi:uncharacterized protein
MKKKMIDFNVKGLALDEQSEMPIVILQNDEQKKVLPLTIGPFEASSIIIELEGIHLARPLTHDLFSELFQRHRFHLVSVEIYDRLNEDYLAKMRYKSPTATHTMEVRPSDGIALALRLHAPILVAQPVVDSYATSAGLAEGADAEYRDVLYLESQKSQIQLM